MKRKDAMIAFLGITASSPPPVGGLVVIGIGVVVLGVIIVYLWRTRA